MRVSACTNLFGCQDRRPLQRGEANAGYKHARPPGTRTIFRVKVYASLGTQPMGHSATSAQSHYV
eukprot:511767-Pyramimonas_sp.AAC.1